MTWHGFVPDLDENEYHAHPTSLSVSGAKTLLKSPALFQWQREHPVHKDIFDIGHAAHKRVLGVGAPVRVINADSWRTKDAKTAKTEAHTAGEIPLLAADNQRVEDMANALSNHKEAVDLLSDGEPEVSAFAPDEATSVLRRSRFDYLRDDVAVDYKSTHSAAPREFAKACANYGYAMQHAWYVDIATDLGHAARSLVFIVQEKEPPYAVECYELDFESVQWGRERNRAALERFRDCTAAGIWPGYTGDTTIKPLSLPGWAFKESA